MNVTLSLNKMASLIESGKYDEAVEIWSNTENGTKKEGYRIVALNLSRHNKAGEHTELIKEYYNKSCHDQEYTRCVEYGKFLEKQKQYKEAEKIYLLLEKKHHDSESLERLYLLYRNPKWTGYDLDKSKYWWDKYFIVMEERKEKSRIARKKYKLERFNKSNK